MTAPDMVVILYSLGGVGTVLLAIAAIIKRNRRRSLRHERILNGDDDNPHSSGVLELTQQHNQRLDTLQQTIEDNHREVVRRIEDDD